MSKANDPEIIQQRIAPIPMKRLGPSEEVAYAPLFLVSDEAHYITGQSIIVDGGQTLPETHFGDYQKLGYNLNHNFQTLNEED